MMSVSRGKPFPPLVWRAEVPSSMTSTVKEERPWAAGTVEVKFHHSKDGEHGWKAVVFWGSLVAMVAGIAFVPGALGLRWMSTSREVGGGLSSTRI